jgi:hypothetical protein
MPAESPDRAVIAKAQKLGAILLSLNGDFADIVAYPPGQLGGIVALQIAIILRSHPPCWTGFSCTSLLIRTSSIIEASCSWLRLTGSGYGSKGICLCLKA